MILHFSFEELAALRAGARTFLGSPGESAAPVAAPPVERERVEALLPRLEGAVRISTLHEQRAIHGAVEVIVDHLRAGMEILVTDRHPADEGAVAAYFDFAHALSVLARIREVGDEMEALIEVVTGAPPTEETARGFVFPD